MIARVATSVEPPATIAVTGANGFLAQHCVDSLLTHGYRVVGTVRDAAKAQVVERTHGYHPNLTTVVVPDITNMENFRNALQLFAPRAVFHLAAPFKYTVKNFEEDLMIPSTEGTRAVLMALKEILSVRRVVFTSSFASIFNANAEPSPQKVYTADDWSPLTYEDGASAEDVTQAYRASKASSERLAWDFMRSQEPGFDLVSLCPGMVFGPFLPRSLPKRIEDLNTSNTLVWRAVKGGVNRSVPPTRGPVWVDVRDVALAHLQALAVPGAGGERFLVAAGVYCNQQLVDVSRERLPKLRGKLAIGQPGLGVPPDHFDVDAKHTEAVLGIKWRGLEECMEGIVPQLFDIEKGDQDAQG